MDTISDDEEDDVQPITKKDKGKGKADDQSQAFADSLFPIGPTGPADDSRKDVEVQFDDSARTKNDEAIARRLQRRLQEEELAHSDSGNGKDFISPKDFPEHPICRKLPEIGFDMDDFLSLPVPMLEIVVGTDASYLKDGWTIRGKLAAGQHTYHVFQFMLEHTSFYFDDVLKVPAMIRNCQTASNRLRANVIELPDVDPYMFGFLVQYLYTQKIRHRLFPDHIDGIPCCSVYDTHHDEGIPCTDRGSGTDTMMSHSIKLWLLAESLEIPALMDYATFCIMTIHSVDPSNHLMKKWWKAAIGACNEDTLLWAMLVDFFSWDDDLFSTLNDYAHWYVKNHEQPLHDSTFKEEPDTNPPDCGEWLLSNRLDGIWMETLDSFLLSVNDERQQLAHRRDASPILLYFGQHCRYFDIRNYYETELEEPYLPHEDFRRPVVHPSNPNAHLAEIILCMKDDLGDFSSHRYLADSLHHLQEVTGAGAKGLVYSEPRPERPSPDQIREEEEMRKTKFKEEEEMRMAKLKEDEARRREKMEKDSEASKVKFIETIKRIDKKHLAKKDEQIAKWKVEGKNQLGQTPAQVKLLEEDKKRANVRKSERARMTNHANRLRIKYKEAQEIADIDGGASFRMVMADLEQLAKQQDIALKKEDIEIEKLERQLPKDFARQRYINDFNPYKDVLMDRVTNKKLIVPPHVLNPDGTTKIVEGGIYWLTGAAKSRFNKELKEEDNIEREQSRWIKTIEPEDCCKGPGPCTGEVPHGAQFTFRDDKGMPLPPQGAMARPSGESGRGNARGRGRGRGGFSGMPERPGSTTSPASQQRPPPTAAAVERDSGTSWRRGGGGAWGTSPAATSTSAAQAPAATTLSTPVPQTPTDATPVAPWAKPGPTPVAPRAPKTVAGAVPSTPSAAPAPVSVTPVVSATSKSGGFQSASDFAAKIVEESVPTRGAGRGGRGASAARSKGAHRPGDTTPRASQPRATPDTKAPNASAEQVKGVDRPGSTTPRASQARTAPERKASDTSAEQVKKTAPTPAVVVEETEPPKRMNNREKRAWKRAQCEAKALAEAEGEAAAAAPEPSPAFEILEVLPTPTPSVAAVEPAVSKDVPAAKAKPTTPKTNPAASDDSAKSKKKLTKVEQKRADTAAAKELKAKEQAEREEREAREKEEADAAAAVADTEAEAQPAKDEEARIAREAEEAAPRVPAAFNAVNWASKTTPEASSPTTSSAVGPSSPASPSSAAGPSFATGPNSATARKALAPANNAVEELIQGLADFAAKVMHQFDPSKPEALCDNFQALAQALYRFFELLPDPLSGLFLKADDEKDPVAQRQALRKIITDLPQAQFRRLSTLVEHYGGVIDSSISCSWACTICDELPPTQECPSSASKPRASAPVKAKDDEFQSSRDFAAGVVEEDTTTRGKEKAGRRNAMGDRGDDRPGGVMPRGSQPPAAPSTTSGTFFELTAKFEPAFDPKLDPKATAKRPMADAKPKPALETNTGAAATPKEKADLKGTPETTPTPASSEPDTSKPTPDRKMPASKPVDDAKHTPTSYPKIEQKHATESMAPDPKPVFGLAPPAPWATGLSAPPPPLIATPASTSARAKEEGFQSAGDFAAKIVEESGNVRGRESKGGKGMADAKPTLDSKPAPVNTKPDTKPSPTSEPKDGSKPLPEKKEPASNPTSDTKPMPSSYPKIDSRHATESMAPDPKSLFRKAPAAAWVNGLGATPPALPPSTPSSKPVKKDEGFQSVSDFAAKIVEESGNSRGRKEKGGKSMADAKPKLDSKPTPENTDPNTKPISASEPKHGPKPAPENKTPSSKPDTKPASSSYPKADMKHATESMAPDPIPIFPRLGAPAPWATGLGAPPTPSAPTPVAAATPVKAKDDDFQSASDFAAKIVEEFENSHGRGSKGGKGMADAKPKLDPKPTPDNTELGAKPMPASESKHGSKPALENTTPSSKPTPDTKPVTSSYPKPNMKHAIESMAPDPRPLFRSLAAPAPWAMGLDAPPPAPVLTPAPTPSKAKDEGFQGAGDNAAKIVEGSGNTRGSRGKGGKGMADAKPKLDPKPKVGNSKPETKSIPSSYPKPDQKHASESMALDLTRLFGVAPPVRWSTGPGAPPTAPAVPTPSPAKGKDEAKDESLQSAGYSAAKIVEESGDTRGRGGKGGEGMADAKPKVDSKPTPDNTKPDAKPAPEKTAPNTKPAPFSHPQPDLKHASESMAPDPKPMFGLTTPAPLAAGLRAPVPTHLSPTPAPEKGKEKVKDGGSQNADNFAAKIVEKAANTRGRGGRGGKGMGSVRERGRGKEGGQDRPESRTPQASQPRPAATTTASDVSTAPNTQPASVAAAAAKTAMAPATVSKSQPRPAVTTTAGSSRVTPTTQAVPAPAADAAPVPAPAAASTKQQKSPPSAQPSAPSTSAIDFTNYSGAPTFKLSVEAFVADTLAEVTAKIDREGLVTPPRPPPPPTGPASAITDRVTAAVGEVMAKLDAERAERARLQLESAEKDRKTAVASAFKLVEGSESYRGRGGRGAGRSGWGMGDVRGRGWGRGRGAGEMPASTTPRASGSRPPSTAGNRISAAPTTQAVPTVAVAAAPSPGGASTAGTGDGGAGSPVPPPVVLFNSFAGPRGRGRGVWRGRRG